MANKFCAKCGREATAGKRFCGGCGQAMPETAAPLNESAVAAPVCGQCGADLTPGKRFCKQCGHAVGSPATAAETAPAAQPAVSVCGGCGAELNPGKRFCKLCGKPVDAPTNDSPQAESLAAPAVSPNASPEEPLSTTACAVTAPGTESVTAPETDSVTAPETEVHYQAEFAPEALPASRWEEVKEIVPPPAAASTAAPEPVPLAVPGDRPMARIGLAIGIAAAVLAAAGGGWAWYTHAHRCTSCTTKSSAETPQPTAQAGTSAMPAITTEQARPPAGTPAAAVAGAPRTRPQTAPAPSPAPDPALPLQARNSSPSGYGNPAAPTPVFNAPPAQGRSGVRHYQGPPVPHGGTVVFDNLPKARLRFTFDHAAWQLTIKANPDGTKRVTLSSLAQGYQSSCDLGWEIVD